MWIPLGSLPRAASRGIESISTTKGLPYRKAPKSSLRNTPGSASDGRYAMHMFTCEGRDVGGGPLASLTVTVVPPTSAGDGRYQDVHIHVHINVQMHVHIESMIPR